MIRGSVHEPAGSGLGDGDGDGEGEGEGTGPPTRHNGYKRFRSATWFFITCTTRSGALPPAQVAAG